MTNRGVACSRSFDVKVLDENDAWWNNSPVAGVVLSERGIEQCSVGHDQSERTPAQHRFRTYLAQDHGPVSGKGAVLKLPFRIRLW